MLARVFYEQPAMTFPGFVRFFDPALNPARLLVVATAKAGDGAGFGWFDDVIPGVRAIANLCMRRKYWGRAAEEATRLALDYIFGAHGVQRVFGLTPATNRLAIAHALRCGFRRLAVIPGLAAVNTQPTDVVVTCLERERFNGQGW